MKLSQKTAALILAASVLFSVGFGGWRSLASMEKKVTEIFYNGVEGDGVGVYSDLTASRNAAVNLATVAKRYLSADDKAVAAVEQAAAALAAAEDIEDCYREYSALSNAVKELSLQLGEQSLSEKDANYRENLLAEFNSRRMSMGYDGYNNAAAEFNTAINAFPASLFGKDALALFR